MRQFAAIFGRAVMTTLPLISALALRFLMFTLPICLATLPPSRPPSASPTAPVAFDDSEPVTLSVPVSGVASDSTSCAPVAVIGPREAVQPISAFCRICDTGLSALPAKLRGALRSAASRIADSAIDDRRHHGGAARRRRQRRQLGKHRRAGSWRAAHSQSMTFRLAKNETAITASAIRIVLRCIGRRIVPPDRLKLDSVLQGGRGRRQSSGGCPPSKCRIAIHIRKTAPANAGAACRDLNLENLERDDNSSNRHPALSACLSMILFGKPVPTFPDHSLADGRPRSARRSVIGSTITLVPTLTRE